MGVFDKIKLGLEEAIAYEAGTLEVTTKKITIAPICRYDAISIKKFETQRA